MHKPVLLKEVIESLDPQPGDFMIDGTLDGGGHAAAIMEKIMPGGKFLGVDWDEAMITAHESRLANRKDFKFVHANYAELPEILKKEKLPLADGLLLDLGFSSEQLEHSGRGFSFSERSKDEPLLMTYDDSRPSVAQILREIEERKLADVIYELGGERLSRRIAKAIKESGRRSPILTSGALADIVRECLPKHYERGRIDPATRTFQALRIYANGELENLSKILAEIQTVVAPGGRVAIISFHSLEDRIVKRAFQALAKEEKAKLVIKKPITASEEEARDNPRSRSAKLRSIKIT